MECEKCGSTKIKKGRMKNTKGKRMVRHHCQKCFHQWWEPEEEEE